MASEREAKWGGAERISPDQKPIEEEEEEHLL
jgi:hypothetical protein